MASATVTWVGHATVLVEVDGVRIITDPALTSRMVHLRRRRPAPDIGRVDAVLVSHVHMDHLHLRSMQRLGSVPRLVVPAGAEALVSSVAADDLHPVRPGDELEVAAGISVEVVHAEHGCRRGPHSKVVAQPVGYVIRIGAARIYFAGDTDLFDAMDDLGPIDVALLPIWGWGPSLGEKHLDPLSAATATRRIAPDRVVPIHWGTYSPLRPMRGDPPWLERPLDSFRTALAGEGHEHRLLAVEPGGSFTVDV
jgi:L-ascorbate metabolism protein UlaG (beta-lactamase superfamily)